MGIKLFHIVQNISSPRDPDRRREAFAFCGEVEECSGSGKHSMARTPEFATCERCKAQYNAYWLRVEGE